MGQGSSNSFWGTKECRVWLSIRCNPSRSRNAWHGPNYCMTRPSCETLASLPVVASRVFLHVNGVALVVTCVPIVLLSFCEEALFHFYKQGSCALTTLVGRISCICCTQSSKLYNDEIPAHKRCIEWPVIRLFAVAGSIAASSAPLMDEKLCALTSCSLCCCHSGCLTKYRLTRMVWIRRVWKANARLHE